MSSLIKPTSSTSILLLYVRYLTLIKTAIRRLVRRILIISILLKNLINLSLV